MNVSVPLTNAPAVQGIINPNDGTAPTYSGYTGAGVIVGIVSSGLDLAHADFKSDDTHTRVIAMWDQLLLGTPPAGQNYGTEITPNMINTNPFVSLDNGTGRGTHLAGIAAGNGRATGGTCAGLHAYRYIGMAPQADLVIVKIVGTEKSIKDAVAYVFAVATAAGEPAVVLIDSADTAVIPHWNQRGAHDGSYEMEQTLSAMTGPGKLVVAPVGDNALDAIHSSFTLDAGGSGSLAWTVPAYSPSSGEFIRIQAWHDPTASFQVKLHLPSGATTAWIQPGTGTGIISNSVDGSYYVNNDMTADTVSKGGTVVGKLIEIQVYHDSGTGSTLPAVGAYSLEVSRLGPATTGRLDAWVAEWRLGSGGVSPVFTTNLDSTMCAAVPANGDSVVSVSCYTSRSTWTNFNCQTSFYQGSLPFGAIYSKSNQGPRRDGTQSLVVQVPDVAAPGEGVISALTQALAGGAGNLMVDDRQHWILRSTLQAAAHVAGALALRMQQFPALDPTGAKSYLHSTALADSNTGGVPNNSWGSGKLTCESASTVSLVGGRPFIHKVGIKPD